MDDSGPSAKIDKSLDNTYPVPAPQAEASTFVVHQTLDNHHRTYRARPIPRHYDINSLAAALADALQLSHISEIKIGSIAADPSGPTTPYDTATISFLRTPKLPPPKDNMKASQIFLSGDKDEIFIDSHFEGFTPLSPLKDDDKRDIDCIAIHGWGGHAFGSFRASNEYMWLRDGLAHQVPRFRVWTYGYESKLRTEKSIANFYDDAQEFQHLLREMRGEESGPLGRIRPIILIVHSLGGMVFKQAYISMAKSKDLRDEWNFRSTYGVLFFGVPNNGMEANALMTMIGDKPQRFNLALLNRESGNRLRFNEHQEFCRVFHFKDSKIIQFFELHKTHSVEMSEDKTSPRRTGALEIFVDFDSATSGREWENTNDYKIGIRADHSGIVKFGPNKDNNYSIVKGILRDFSKAAGPTIETRFSPDPSVDSCGSPRNSADPASPTTSNESLGKSNNYQHHAHIDAQRPRSERFPVTTPAKKSPTCFGQTLPQFFHRSGLIKPSDFIKLAKDGEDDKLQKWLQVAQRAHINKETINEALIAASGNRCHTGNQAAVIRYLIEKGAHVQYKDSKMQCTPLIWAIKVMREDLVDVILQQETLGAFIETRDGREDWTPLLWAVSLVISSRGSSSSENILRRLIGKNANIGATDRKMKWTLLHWAASEGADNIIEILFKDGSRALDISNIINLEDRRKQTPLTLACHRNHQTIAKLLIQNGANRNVEIMPKIPLLIRVVGMGNEPLARTLLEGKGLSHSGAGEDPTESIESTGSDNTPLPAEVNEKQKRTEMLEAKDGDGHTALWWAVNNRYTKLQELLIEWGAKP